MFSSLAKLVSKSSVSPLLNKQIHASKTFFEKQLPSFTGEPLAEKDRLGLLKKFKGPIYNITSLDAHNVVAGLSDIVNDPEQFKKNKTFYLLIQGNPKDELEELFRLRAGPTKHQPGNGIVFLRPRGNKTFTGGAKKYDELNGALKAHYETNTKQFAEDIKQLFKNNAKIDDFPEATSEAYMILLYEIGRRLVKSENPTDLKEAYDVLPIGNAIARVIKLLERGDGKTCLFEDVFLPGGKFHCFTGKPEKREQAIENINKAISEITKQEAVTEEELLKELEELFCAKKLEVKMPSKEEEMKKEFEALTVAEAALLHLLFLPDLQSFYEE